MRKTAITIVTGLVLFICNHQNSFAGCGGVCITTLADNNYSDLIDTAYLDQNSGVVNLFATYNSCCQSLFSSQNPTMKLVWYKDGLPIDTTDIYDANSSVVGLYTTTFSVILPGIYEVFFIDFQGANFSCRKVQVMRTQELGMAPAIASNTTNSLEIPEERNNYRIYPNPTTEGFVYIDQVANIHSIEVYNVGGLKLISIKPNGSEIVTIHTAELKPGLYIVRIDNGKSITNEKIIVK